MNSINGDRTNSVFAIAFSCVKRLEEYLTVNNLDLLVISRNIELSQKLTELIGDTRLLYLTETRVQSSYMEDEGLVVCKYSKVSVILEKILEILEFSDSRFKRKLCKTYAVISPIGRCGKTRLAMGICYSDEVRGGLYMGMEAYGYIPEEVEVKYTMSDILYLATIRSEQLEEYLVKSIIKAGDIAVIPSPDFYSDLKEFHRQDMEWLLDRIIATGKFTTVVCDIDGAVLGDVKVLGAFDRVVMPILEDSISLCKIKSFKKILMENELGKLAESLIEVNVPDEAYDTADMIRCVGRVLENEG
jgi:hypothetical protein